jgi:hypothetical protein
MRANFYLVFDINKSKNIKKFIVRISFSSIY